MSSPVSLSDITTRLRMWSPLAPYEVPSVANILSEKRSELDETESRIRSLEQELLQLKNRRKRLLEDIKASQALLAPIRSLPLELLLEIFALICTGSDLRYVEYMEVTGAIEESDEDEYEYETSIKTTVTVPSAILSQVCSTWNSVVNHSALLWSTLSLRFDMARKPMDSNFLFARHVLRVQDALAYVLNHSENETLHIISLSFKNEGEEEINPRIASLLTYFLDQSHRWKTATLDIAHIDDLLLTQLCMPMPALETLSFSTGGNINRVHAFFGQAPSLRSVTFGSLDAFQQSQPVWANLHTLAFEPEWGPPLRSISQLKNILSQCKSLCTLSWNGSIKAPENDDDKRSVVLPVTSLTGGANIDHLFPHIRLPHMKTFHLRLVVPNDAYEKVLSSQQEEYRHIITTLEVKTRSFLIFLQGARSIQTMFAQLGSFSELQSLTLDHPSKEGPACAFECMSQRFPKLKTLFYTIRGDIPASVLDELFSLLKAFQQTTDESPLRPNSLRMLQRVELIFPDRYIEAKDLVMFRELQDNGLLLEVRDAATERRLANVS